MSALSIPVQHCSGGPYMMQSGNKKKWKAHTSEREKKVRSSIHTDYSEKTKRSYKEATWTCKWV